MSNEAVALIGFVSLFALMLLRVPVGMAMGLVGITGFGYLTGLAPALKLVGQTTMRTVTDYSFGVIPMFLLMGAFVSVSGISRELFRAANTFVGHWKGGLGIATIAACGGFAAISGSSVATAATFSAVAYPEMRRFGYPQSFATGVIAVGGTLGAMLPPSTVLAVYGIITQQDIGKLFIAGIVPGLLAIVMHMITIGIIGVVRPGFLPAGPRSSWRDRLVALRDVWSPLLLFIFVIGGLYGGFFIPTEAGAVGAVGAFIIGVLRGKLNKDGILQSLLQATRTAAAVFTVLIGALCFGYFLTITQTPQNITAFLTGLGIGPYGVLALILLMYLVLGCLMDAMAMVILTVPIVFPVVTALGFDPIWFGIVIVMTVELGLIHPPVGMNVFVIKSVIKDVNMSTIFVGVLPFVVTDLIRLVLLILFPLLATWLPHAHDRIDAMTPPATLRPNTCSASPSRSARRSSPARSAMACGGSFRFSVARCVGRASKARSFRAARISRSSVPTALRSWRRNTCFRWTTAPSSISRTSASASGRKRRSTASRAARSSIRR